MESVKDMGEGQRLGQRQRQIQKTYKGRQKEGIFMHIFMQNQVLFYVQRVLFQYNF